MDQPAQNQSSDFIRITHGEAMSGHVDDLVRRQTSLRGEGGVTRDHGRRWYYQNWFLFMVAGAVAAFAAWAILEPFFDDMLYLQGPITEIHGDDAFPERVQLPGDDPNERNAALQSSITVNGHKLWLMKGTTEFQEDGQKSPVSLERLKPGMEVGVYVHYVPTDKGDISLAMFIVPEPKTPAPAKSRLSLSQQHARTAAAGLLFFALVGGLIGLAIGAVDGCVCRLFRRALLAGSVGFLVGFVGGFVSNILANLAYAPLNALAMKQPGDTGSLSAFGFTIQMVGRGLAWLLAGMAMGLGQGITLRSGRLLLYGFLGGIIGGLLGGLLFDPIDLLLLGVDKPSAHWSRMVGLVVVGASVGAMIGIVELLARDAWLRMIEGPLSGKEFLIFKDVMNVGSSPRAEIYLFNDPQVAGIHATIRAIGDDCEIENLDKLNPAQVNGRIFQRTRLRHGDQIRLGRTLFVFQRRQG